MKMQDIDHQRLAQVSGGTEAQASEPEGFMARAERWASEHDVEHYSVGAATGIALGPLIAHAAEKSWAALKWGGRMARRVR